MPNNRNNSKPDIPYISPIIICVLYVYSIIITVHKKFVYDEFFVYTQELVTIISILMKSCFKGIQSKE